MAKTWQAWDVAAGKKATMTNPHAVQNKKGMWMVQGKSKLTGNTISVMAGKTKPAC